LHHGVDERVVVHGPGCSSLTSRVNRCSADAAAPEPPLPVAREELRVGDEEQAADEEHGQAQHAQKSGCRPVEPEHEHEPRPWLFQRLEPATAGTVGFLIRLTTTAVVVVIALRVAGLAPSTLALGGAVTAVVVGLAAQQTLSHVIAGTVLASAQPFRVGERVRLQGGPLAGTIEGQITSVGLLYTTVALGENEVLVPNSVVMSVAVVPLREPPGIDLRARLHVGVTPAQVERALRDAIQTSLRDGPHVDLEEVGADEVVVRITATPTRPADGPQLASEVVRALVPYAAGASDNEQVSV
jgi:small-conductance mechanosensitive channel